MSQFLSDIKWPVQDVLVELFERMLIELPGQVAELEREYAVVQCKCQFCNK